MHKYVQIDCNLNKFNKYYSIRIHFISQIWLQFMEMSGSTFLLSGHHDDDEPRVVVSIE